MELIVLSRCHMYENKGHNNRDLNYLWYLSFGMQVNCSKYKPLKKFIQVSVNVSLVIYVTSAMQIIPFFVVFLRKACCNRVALPSMFSVGDGIGIVTGSCQCHRV